MKIAEFIEKYNTKKFVVTKNGVDEKYEYIKKELEIKDYVSFVEKRELCEKVLKACNTVDRNSGLIKIDSVSRYFMFTTAVILKYTNLEFSSGEDDVDAFDEYDMLCKSKLLNSILGAIGEEYTSCNNMLNMMMDDELANHNTVENVIGNILKNISISVDNLIDVFAEKVEEMELDLSQIDIDKYKGLIDMLPKK